VALIRVVAFGFGHTLVDEEKDASVPLQSRPVHLMPEVNEVLLRIRVPMAVWANTRTATGSDLQRFLDRAGIGRFFAWVVTSVDAGFRKPAPQFFDFALRKCGLARDEVLFVGNQLDTDIAGGQEYGIRTAPVLIGAPMKTPSPRMFARLTQSRLFASFRLFSQACVTPSDARLRTPNLCSSLQDTFHMARREV
jgi:FMN phosphatase YigB (HAD superfamily)